MAKTTNTTQNPPESSSPITERRPYKTPTVTKKRAVDRVTLASGMGAMTMGALTVMN